MSKFTVKTQRHSIDASIIVNEVSADFQTAEETISAIVARIECKIRYLSSYGCMIKGVTISEAKDTAREIRGMISALDCVCESRTLQSELLDDLATARAKALDRLRK